MFRVIIHRKALKEINNLTQVDKKRVINILEEMKSDPFLGDVKPIKTLKSTFRIRIGNLRIMFAVNFDAAEAIVLKVGRREKFYEEI